MNKNTNMKKTLISVVAAVLVFAGLYWGVTQINKPKVTVGEKTITIVITDQKAEEVYSETFNSDSELLGELLDEVNELEEEALFVFDGSKDSEFGRFITAISLLQLEDGQFWVYDSDNNEVCAAEAFCPGVDMLAIEDGDNFSFNVLLP